MSPQDRSAIKVTLPLRVYREVETEAVEAGITPAEWVRRAVHYALRRGENLHRYRELTLTPRGDSTADALFTWLCARRPLLSDIQSASEETPARLQRAMRRALTEAQYRRMDLVVIKGWTLEAVGQADGCSKQAVSAAVKRAADTLAKDRRFLEALVEMFPDSGLDADTLLLARRHHVR